MTPKIREILHPRASGPVKPGCPCAWGPWDHAVAAQSQDPHALGPVKISWCFDNQVIVAWG